MSNFTQTIEIPYNRSEVQFIYDEKSTLSYSEQHSIHYNKYTAPIFEKINEAVNKIKDTQRGDFNNTIDILWNKCRYFEMTCYNKELLRFVAQSAKLAPKYGNMFVGGRTKLEAVVRAFNKKGVYCRISQDWI